MEIKLLSWNVAGVRAAFKKGFWEKIALLQPDIISIQETKADISILQQDDMNQGFLTHTSYPEYRFHSAEKKGYSGVASLNSSFLHADSDTPIDLYEYQAGVGEAEFDIEGRCIITKYSIGDLDFTLINCYYPQGGRGPHRIEYKIAFYKKIKDICNELKAKGELLILTGDFNTTVADIDLARPAQNRKTTGCLPEEREALDWFLKDGFVDSFRHFYPDKPDMYTYWDQITRARERNVGWRIDFFLIDEDLLPYLKSASIETEVEGSDHAPICIILEV
jgi:exodeoxyribonuclease III